MRNILAVWFFFCVVTNLRAQIRTVYDTLIDGHVYHSVSYQSLKYKIYVRDSVEYVSHVTSNPEFSGELNKWASDSIHYPDNLIIPDFVIIYVSLTIEKNGLISNVKILRGANSYLDNEVRKDVSMMPKWKPGIRHGQKVVTHMILSVMFRIIARPYIIKEEHKASMDSVY